MSGAGFSSGPRDEFCQMESAGDLAGEFKTATDHDVFCVPQMASTRLRAWFPSVNPSSGDRRHKYIEYMY